MSMEVELRMKRLHKIRNNLYKSKGLKKYVECILSSGETGFGLLVRLFSLLALREKLTCPSG